MSLFKKLVSARTAALLIVLFFIFDRALSIGFLLPEFCVEDERWLQEGAVKMVRGLTLNPGTHKYPELMFILTASIYAAGWAAVNVKTVLHLESLESLAWVLSKSHFAFAPTIILGRLLCAFLGAVSLLFFYRLARKVFGEYQALIAMILFATAPAFLFSTQLLKTDALVVLGVMLTIIASLKVLERGTALDYLIAGMALGLCLAAKYHAVAVVPILFAHRLRHPELSWWRTFIYRGRWWLIAPAALFAFIILSPWSWLDIEGTINQGMLEWAIQNRFDPLLRRSNSLWWHFPVLFMFSAVLPLALGIPLYLFSMIGLIFFTDLRDPRKLVLWSYPLGLIAFMIGFSELGAPHLYTTAIPFFALFAASLLAPLMDREAGWQRLAAVVILAGIILYNLLLFHSFNYYEEYALKEPVAKMESTHQPGHYDLAFVPYFPNPDLDWQTRFLPQFSFNESILAELDPDRILIHHTFYHSYLDNRDLLAEPAVADMVLAHLRLQARKLGYKEQERWIQNQEGASSVFTGDWYRALWPDLNGLWSSIYVKEPLPERGSERSR